MADKTYALDFTIHDPKTGTDSVKTVTFTVPQGPKGDSRGVSAKRVATMQEFSSLYKALTDTQQIIGMVAFTDSTGIPIRQSYASLHVIDDVIRYSLALQDSSSGTELTTVDFSIDVETGPFKISSGSSLIDADYVDVYIYDSDDTPTGPMYLDLSGEADYQIYQSLMVGNEWDWVYITANFTTVADVRNRCGTQAQSFVAGSSYVALFSSKYGTGVRASVFTVGSDGSSITWDSSKQWDIPAGAQIAMPNGAVYLVLRKAASSNTPIYDCVKPVSGKIPLELPGNNSVTIQGMESVEIKKTATANSGANWSIYIQDCKDTEIFVDTSSNDASINFSLLFWLKGKNRTLNLGGTFWSNPGSGSYSMDIPVNAGDTSIPGCNRDYLYSDDPDVQTVYYFQRKTGLMIGGKETCVSYRLSLVGYNPSIQMMPYGVSSTNSLSSPMSAPAKAMAMSMSEEPEMSQEDLEKIIKGKKGIFTVKDGMAYDLLTGEYLM